MRQDTTQRADARDLSEAISNGLGSRPATTDEQAWLRSMFERHGERETLRTILPVHRVAAYRILAALPISRGTLLLLRQARRASQEAAR